ncbi:MAG: serine/threonine-protein kinase [Planctomycetota bacterium]|nr:serine/threonine-protein kinase [Planctomycetota bacterium]MDI6786794.1 serine/threonine-protein kinase [Planctomycetota bacterium]
MEKLENISFDNIAVQLGFITPEKVNECLEIKRKMQEMGITPKKLSEIMVDKKYLNETQVKIIRQKQGLESGAIQIAGYKIVGIIGQGAMGTVYKAVQLSMQREIALKVLSPHLLSNEKSVDKFFKEARVVARLNHPNIIQGIDVGESNALYYFAMEYVEGKTLGDIIKSEGPMEEKRLINIIIQIARALEHAHKNNMVHRDIKPDNILISNKDNTAKLCDLGLALLSIGEPSQQQRKLSGTPAYISPEQGRGEPDVDVRSDIYSLGATTYYAITGELPFKGDTSAIVINKHINEQPISPKQKRPQISDVINSIILKMMSKARESRYQTPTDLITDLEKALKIPSVPQVPVKPPLVQKQPLIGKVSEATLRRLKAKRFGQTGHVSRFKRFKR